MDRGQATGRVGKRKAPDDQENNERLAKRLSLLNLERNGEKLNVAAGLPSVDTSRFSKPKPPAQTRDDDTMQLDDSKHKVYIYDIDAELSESESDDGKLIFLPDIEKHLRASQIPQSIRANSEGELAGNKQLVLYNIPSSLTVPKEQDSVRKAIIEARARVRARPGQTTQAQDKDIETPNGSLNGGTGPSFGYHGTLGEALSTISTIPEADEYDPDAMDLG